MTIGFYWKLTLSRQYTWFDHPDMAYLEIPRLQFQAAEIHKGRFPLWDPNIWSGQPLIGQTQPGPLFPLNLLFYLAPLKDGYLQFRYLNFYWALIHGLAVWFAYLLARSWGLSHASSIVAGAGFGFGGFVGTVAWIDVANGAIWAPLVLLFISKSVGSSKPLTHAALGGLTLGVCWMSGHHELPILISLMAAGVWLWYCWQDPKRLRLAAIFFLITFLISAVQTLATFEFGRLSIRWLGIEKTVSWKDKIPYTVHAIYSLPFKGLLATFLPGFGRFADSSPFLGVVLVGLAMVGAIGRWRVPMVRILASLCILASIYAVGTFAPLQGVMYSLLPIVDKARIPSRAILLVDFALAMLAAFGLELILSDTLSRVTRWFRFVILGFGAFLLLICIGLTMWNHEVDDRTVLTGLTCLGIAAVLTLWQKSWLPRTATFGCLLGLAIIELSNAGPALYTNEYDKNANQYLKSLTQHHEIADYLRSYNNGPVRVVVDDQAIGANFGDWHGLAMLQGYVAGVSANVTVHEFHTKRTQQLFSVTHYIGTKPDKEGQERVFEGPLGVHVFRNPDSLPWVRTVHEAKPLEDERYLRIAIQDPATDLSQTAFFYKTAPELEQCEGKDAVQLESRTTDRLVIQAEMACRGLLVVSETMYPGWETKIDGRRVPMLEAYGSLRSAVLDGGKHRVEMRFRPTSVYVGAGCTVVGLLLLGLVAVIEQRKKVG